MDVQQSIARLLDGWSEAFATWFARHHRIPPALEAKRLLDEQFAGPPTVRELAKRVGCSKTTFVELFSSEFGLPPSEYVARLRIREGLLRLRRTSEPVDEIARSVGYESVNKFYARLRTFTGLKPLQVRQLTEREFRRLMQEFRNS